LDANNSFGNLGNALSDGFVGRFEIGFDVISKAKVLCSCQF
jgi:hypothetical protein